MPTGVALDANLGARNEAKSLYTVMRRTGETPEKMRELISPGKLATEPQQIQMQLHRFRVLAFFNNLVKAGSNTAKKPKAAHV